MGRIKIGDLPEDHKIGKEVMKKVMGGGGSLEDLSTILAFDLQTAMSRYTQASTARSNISKKQQQSTDSVIKNIA